MSLRRGLLAFVATALGCLQAPRGPTPSDRPAGDPGVEPTVRQRVLHGRGLASSTGSEVAFAIRIEASHRYDVPVDQGFAFVTDTANWSRFWPGFVRLEPESTWGAPGDTARLVTRILGRERTLTMTLTTFDPNQLVTYTSTQPGLPDARHERVFERDGDGFVYRLVVEYDPRDGLAGVLDRLLLPRGIRRAFEQTFAALERELTTPEI